MNRSVISRDPVLMPASSSDVALRPGAVASIGAEIGDLDQSPGHRVQDGSSDGVLSGRPGAVVLTRQPEHCGRAGRHRGRPPSIRRHRAASARRRGPCGISSEVLAQVSPPPSRGATRMVRFRPRSSTASTVCSTCRSTPCASSPPTPTCRPAGAGPTDPGSARLLADRRAGCRGHQRLHHRVAGRSHRSVVHRSDRHPPGANGIATPGGAAGHRSRRSHGGGAGRHRSVRLGPPHDRGWHDTASAIVGVPADTPNFAYISCGTWGLVGVELDAPVLTEDSRAANFTNERGVDGTIRYLRNVMGLWLLSETLRAWELHGQTHSLTDLVAQAAAIPAGGPTFDPDAPEFLPPGDMPSRIAAACRNRGSAHPSRRPRSCGASWTTWPPPSSPESLTRSGFPASGST